MAIENIIHRHRMGHDPQRDPSSPVLTSPPPRRSEAEPHWRFAIVAVLYDLRRPPPSEMTSRTQRVVTARSHRTCTQVHLSRPDQDHVTRPHNT
jgi:hypothetical protein